jgi:hypothetical protein
MRRQQEGEARWGLRRGDVIAPIGARQTTALLVRDCLAAANGMEVPKNSDAPKVGTMTAGCSAEHGNQLLRRGQTRECGTRKAKIEAKL